MMLATLNSVILSMLLIIPCNTAIGRAELERGMVLKRGVVLVAL